MHKQISSLQNPVLKQIILLSEKSRERRKSGLFVIEGLRELNLALKSGYVLKTLLFCNEILSESAILKLKEITSSETEFIEITPEVYRKIAYRNSTEGVLAIAQSKDLSIQNFKLTDKNPLLLIAEAPEKPGNIGALLRTADAANVSAVLIANPKTDLYNPNIIRSSVGGIFTNTIATGTTEEILHFLQKNKINSYCAALQASVNYTSCDYSKPTAIIVGTEAVGLTEKWLQQSTQNICIPMAGALDSMNVSVAAGILIFEVVRQRNFQQETNVN